MTVVNSKEFSSNQKRYYNLAVNEDVFIRRGKNIFQLLCTNINGMHVDNPNINGTPTYERVYFEPDEDFYRSISATEFKKRALEIVEKIHNQYSKK